MHVGIDTVALKGKGFHPRVKKRRQGQGRRAADRVRLDFLATHAKSLLTQIVITNSERVTAWERASGLVAAGKDTLFTVSLAAEEAAAVPTARSTTVTSEADRDSESDRTARAARGGAGEPGEGLSVDDQTPAGRPPGQCPQRDGDHGPGGRRTERMCRSWPAGRTPRPPSKNSPRCWPKGRATRVARRRRRRPRPRFPWPPHRRRGASPTIRICCSASRRRRDWRWAKCSRSAARRSPSPKRVQAWTSERRQLAPRHRRRAGTARGVARQAARQGRSRARPRSSPRTRS